MIKNQSGYVYRKAFLIMSISFIAMLVFVVVIYTFKQGTAEEDQKALITEQPQVILPLVNEENMVKSVQYAELQSQIVGCLSGKQGDYSIGFCELSNPHYLLINSKKMPSASVIKLFIMIHAFKEYSNQTLSLDRLLVVQEDDKVGGTGSLANKPSGTKVSIRELIELMITESDNTATNMLIEKLGFEPINATIKDLSCTDTVLQRKMMDFSSAKEGKENYTSVADLVAILYKIANNQCLGPPYDENMVSILTQQKQRNMIPEGVPPKYTVANKCGALPGVVNDVAIVFSEDGGYILCVLSNNVPERDAQSTIVEISKAAFDYYDMVLKGFSLTENI